MDLTSTSPFDLGLNARVKLTYEPARYECCAGFSDRFTRKAKWLINLLVPFGSWSGFVSYLKERHMAYDILLANLAILIWTVYPPWI